MARATAPGSATALVAVEVPTEAEGAGWWNRVVGLDDATDDAALDALLALYRTAGLRYGIDLTPTTLSPALARRVAARGGCAAEAGAVSYGLPTVPAAVATAPLAAGAAVQEVGTGDVELIATLWADGFELPQGEERQHGMRLRSGWFRVPESRCYVAFAGARPAAMASASSTSARPCPATVAAGCTPPSRPAGWRMPRRRGVNW